MPTSTPRSTRSRGLDLNCSRSTFPRPPWTWKRRRPLMRAVLADVAPSWTALQECTPTQDKDMRADLKRITGDEWRSYGYVNVRVQWNHRKWKAIKQWHGWMQGGGRKRYCVMVCLERRDTKARLIVCSAHLSVKEPKASTWRARQARTMDGFLDRFRRATGCNKVVIGIDLNSSANAPRGVRGVFADLGYRSLFATFPTAKIKNGTANTHKGYGKATTAHHEAKRIDDVLVLGAVELYRPEVIETGNATDHRGLQVSAAHR